MANLSKYRRVVIIRMYKDGISPERICEYVDIHYEKIKQIIETYFKIKL